VGGGSTQPARARVLRTAGAFVALALISVIGLTRIAPGEADTFSDSSFSTETIATVPPFTLVGLEFAPDGRLFVWQKNGVVRIIKNGALLPTPFIDLSAKVNTFDDRGFWGFAFDPDFANNGYVYMTYTYENAGNPNSSAERTSRLVRVTASSVNPDVALPASETVIMGSVGTPPCSAQPAGADCIPADGGSHTIGSVVFAEDGTMFVGVGDGSDGDFLALRSQDLNSVNGKILRINKDGTAPADNPFYDGTNSIRSKVWLYGVRNPFRFAQQPGTERLMFGEVGWNTWEEVNVGVKGANYGWPCYEGVGTQSTFQSYPTCQALAPSSVVPPFYTYNHSQGSAAIGGPFYTGNAYPQQYQGNFFFGDYSGDFIKRVVFDANGDPVSVQPFATNVPAPVSMVIGPDGLMYYLSFTTGEIRRIRSNAPVAQASATPSYGYSPLTVNFSSAGSGNAGGGSVSYLWNFGDGTTSTDPNPTHIYTSATPVTLVPTLTVTNSGSFSATRTLSVTVGSVPPTPTITSPAAGTPVSPGQTVSFAGSATDPDDGTLAPSGLSWTVLLHHNSHVHTFVSGAGSSGSFVAQDHGDIGSFSYEVMLTATDSSGLKTSTSVLLPVVADTTPPAAPTGLTATAAGAVRVDLSWTASTDNAAVDHYRVERCAGDGCSNFAEVGAPTATTFSDGAVAPGTSYSYRVRAEDASTNLSGYSNVATATTESATPQPSGLVAGYTFDAGAGATAADLSGNNNNGTINGATWTTGRFGGGLSFNGTAKVQVASAPTLNLTTGMTLAAWIKPTANQNGWVTVIQKQTDAYLLNASNGQGALFPGGGATTSGGWQYVSGTSANPVNVWTHLAVTYDTSSVRLYVNGTQVASQAAIGTIQTTTSPLWIGGNSPYGEYFTGVLDEVRVYNRPLSAAEIQVIRDNALVPPAPDTTLPSTPTGLSTTANGTQVNLSWTASTDNVGVARYLVERCEGAGCSTFSQVGTPTGTTFVDSPLTPNTAYSYRVRAEDLSGNLSGFSNVSSATTGQAAPDTTPPSAPTGVTATVMGTSRIDLSWTASTDNVGVAEYRVERCQGSSCTNWAQVGTSTTTTFSNTGLNANTRYRFRIRAADAIPNVGPYSSIVSAITQAGDTTKPTKPATLTATAAGPNRVDLSWAAATDNVGVTGYRIERCQGAGCTTYAQIDTSPTTTFADTTVVSSTTYRYRVRANDAAGNLGAYSPVATVTTPAIPDTTPPSAPTGLNATSPGGLVNLSWTAATDNVAVKEYRIERCEGDGCSTFAPIAVTTGTSYADTPVAELTSYSYRVRAADLANNLGDFSNVSSVTTPIAPTAPTGLVAGYSFDAGSGSTAADSSGNNNTGTITAATWTTGKYGGALNFNGSARVQVPSAPSLNLTSGMTLAAWIKPTVNQSGWVTIVQKQTDAYALNASNGAGALFPGGGTTTSSGWQYVSASSANPINVWTHVAVTYDGSTVRLYVNGTQVASQAGLGTIQTTTSPLWIGGNNPYGEYFVGVIDDVRVYNRALNAAEIIAVRDNPLT
jgi:glucose/arabinose dehydrogenase/fibronectin type 3 domain-containing protein